MLAEEPEIAELRDRRRGLVERRQFVFFVAGRSAKATSISPISKPLMLKVDFAVENGLEGPGGRSCPAPRHLASLVVADGVPAVFLTDRNPAEPGEGRRGAAGKGIETAA